MATLPQWIEARVIQKIATEAEWNEITLVPYKGEVCLVGDSGGKVVNIKIGDGINVFSDLEYMFDSIQQNVGYIAIESNALPTPLDDVAWGMVTGGTYTFGGSDVFTVPDGHWGIANYSSGGWSLMDMGELPSIPFPIGLINTLEGVFNFDIVSKKIIVNGVGSVNLGKERFVFQTPQEITFDERNNYNVLLFDIDSGLFISVAQTYINTISGNYISVATFVITESGRITVNGIPDYYVNGIKKIDSAKIGLYSGTPGSINFDVVNDRIKTTSVVSAVVQPEISVRYLVQQNQDIPLLGGSSVLIFNTSTGNLRTSPTTSIVLNVNDLVVASITYITSTKNLVVNGISDYYVNGKENKPYLFGMLNSGVGAINFNTVDNKVETGTKSIAVVIPEENGRFVLGTSQSLDLITTNSFQALIANRSGILRIALLSNMKLTKDEFIVATIFYNNSTKDINVNGIPNYYVNGEPVTPSPTPVNAETKFSFSSTLPYYKSTTNLSLSENDPIVLKNQDAEWMYEQYDELVNDFPDYASKVQFGEQPDGNGGFLPLYYYRFKPSNLIKNTTGIGEEELLKVFISPSLHGGEKQAALTTFVLMDDVCRNWKNDPFLESLRWNCEFVIVAVGGPYQWNASAAGVATDGGRKNANGVDPNRNFPIDWNQGSSDPANVTYRGTSPLSEVECQYIADLALQEYTEGAVAFDFHSFFSVADEPKEIAWVISSDETLSAANAFVRKTAVEYKKELPLIDQNEDTPLSRLNLNQLGGMAYKYYRSLGYKSYLMECCESFVALPEYSRNDNNAIKYGTQSMANMLREVIKTNVV